MKLSTLADRFVDRAIVSGVGLAFNILPCRVFLWLLPPERFDLGTLTNLQAWGIAVYVGVLLWQVEDTTKEDKK